MLNYSNMKYYCDILVVLTIISSLFRVSSASYQFKHYLEEKCVKKDAHLIDKSLHLLSNRLELSFTYIPNKVEHFCTVEVAYLKRRAKNASDIFRNCVTGEEAYLPNFLEIGFYGFLNFLCSNYGENIKQLYSEKGIHCVNHLKSNTAYIDVDKCFEEFSPPTVHLTKHKLCHNISKVKHCFDRILNQHCPANKVMPELNARLYHSLTAPCRIKKAPAASPGSASSMKSEVWWPTLMMLLILKKYVV